MSTDYAAACFTCRRHHHLGVRFAHGRLVFGHGELDAEGRQQAAAWLLDHAGHGHDVRVLSDDEVPDDFAEQVDQSKEVT